MTDETTARLDEQTQAEPYIPPYYVTAFCHFW